MIIDRVSSTDGEAPACSGAVASGDPIAVYIQSLAHGHRAATVGSETVLASDSVSLSAVSVSVVPSLRLSFSSLSFGSLSRSSLSLQ